MENRSKRNGCACYFCRRPFSDEIQKTKDHLVARSKGGFDKEENYVDCCWNCNQWKADKTLEQWLEHVAAFLKRGVHKIYTKTELGQITGNIKKLIKQVKGNKNISIYKPQ